VCASEGIYSLEIARVLDVCLKMPTQHCKYFAKYSLCQSLRRKCSRCVHTDQAFRIIREHVGTCNDWDNEAVKSSYTVNDQTTHFSENNVSESIS
jgi:hypothetical protein